MWDTARRWLGHPRRRIRLRTPGARVPQGPPGAGRAQHLALSAAAPARGYVAPSVLADRLDADHGVPGIGAPLGHRQSLPQRRRPPADRQLQRSRLRRRHRQGAGARLSHHLLRLDGQRRLVAGRLLRQPRAAHVHLRAGARARGQGRAAAHLQVERAARRGHLRRGLLPLSGSGANLRLVQPQLRDQSLFDRGQEDRRPRGGRAARRQDPRLGHRLRR